MSLTESKIRILRLTPNTDFAQIQAYWQALEQGAQYSYFMSWAWISTWLALLDDKPKIEFVFAIQGETPVCGFILGKRRSIKHKLILKLRATLNNTGFEEFDELTVEYNQALVRLDHCGLNILFSDGFKEIEEFYLPLVEEHTALNLHIPEGFHLLRQQKTPSYYVDLSALRGNEISYLETLSSKDRRLVRQSISYYEQYGPIQLNEAKSVAQAQAMLIKLKELHEQRWSGKAGAGAFSNPFFENFHRSLIDARFDSGEIQLLEISNHKGTLGYLYNFVHQEDVLFYQSGLQYLDDRNARPGIVSHYHAILHNLEGGKNLYNFLAGESRYKRSLGTNQHCLHSLTVARNTWKSTVEKIIRSMIKK